MSSTTPVLVLLDCILSQDDSGTQAALLDMLRLLRNTGIDLVPESPLQSSASLSHILRMFLSANPGIASVASTNDGSLPLHFAASLGIVEVVRVLFDCYPEAASIPNKKGKIPLHYAAREGRLDVVNFFLQVVPSTASIASDKQKLALHFASGDGHVEVVRALLRVYPQGTSVPSNKGKVPVHFASRWGHLELAHDLLCVDPDCVKTMDWDGSLPLHDAAREGQYRMSRYLVERFPPALAMANLRGEIPLFPAVRSGNLDVIVLLLRAWPTGGKHILRNISPDDHVESWDILELLLRGATGHLQGCRLLEGREPATVCLSEDMVVVAHGGAPHKSKKKKCLPTAPIPTTPVAFASIGMPAMENNPTAKPAFGYVFDSEVRSKSPVLLEDDTKRPAVVVQPEKRKRLRSNDRDVSSLNRVFLPLHAAFECGSSAYVLRVVLDKCESDRNKIDHFGRLPLHWAVEHCRDDADVVRIVVTELITPEAAALRDMNQRLPLHVAIAARADSRVVGDLLKACPSAGVEACRSEDEWCNRKPIELAAHYDCDLSTVYWLLRVDPSFIESLRVDNR